MASEVVAKKKEDMGVRLEKADSSFQLYKVRKKMMRLEKADSSFQLYKVRKKMIKETWFDDIKFLVKVIIEKLD